MIISVTAADMSKNKSHVSNNMTTGPGRAEIPLGVICRKAYRGLNKSHVGNNMTTGPGRAEIPLGVICL